MAFRVLGPLLAAALRCPIMAPVPDRYGDYDPFAWLYNRHWKGRFHPTAIAVMDEILLPRLPGDARILDLCCGVGWLADSLARRGYRVTGVDGSAEMLRYARENASGVELVLDDARSFRLPDSFEAAICVFDSLNHILSIDQLASAFSSVFSSLTAGGLFFFDLNTEAGFRDNWDGVFAIVEDDHVCTFQNSHEPESGLATFEATLFRLLEEGVWKRSGFTLTQRCYGEGEVRAALQQAGFATVEAFGYDRGEGLMPLSATSPRAYFLCRKPSDSVQ